jgi:hypothetical protein
LFFLGLLLGTVTLVPSAVAGATTRAGILITSGDTGAVTNTMLLAIADSKLLITTAGVATSALTGALFTLEQQRLLFQQ